jgi:hypothetical protein
MEALATGFSLERERGLGYTAGYSYATALANRNILSDATTQQAWVIADSATGLLRSQNTVQLFNEFKSEMEEIFTTDKTQGNITPQDFGRGDAWKRVTGMSKNTPLTGPFEPLTNRYVKLRDGLFLHHRMTGYVHRPLTTYLQYKTIP